MTQGDLFIKPFFFTVVYHDGRKSKVREFNQYAQMLAEAIDLFTMDSDVCRIHLCERTNNGPRELRAVRSKDNPPPG